MQIVKIPYKTPLDLPKVALCLGNFDGLHKGHRELFMAARRSDYSPAVLLFDRSAEEVLFPERKHSCITSLEDKLRLLPSLGIEVAFIVNVNRDFYSLSVDGFIDFLKENVDPAMVICGSDFRFANKASGTPDDLKKHFKTEVLPLLNEGGEKVSSTRIIRLIEEGNVSLAAELLARPYEMVGKVKEGLHNGRRIGFPTLNLETSAPYAMPKPGVYSGYSYVLGIPYLSLINVGTNPTVGSLNEPIVESHLLSYKGDAYGKTIYVEFRERIRDEIKFPSLEELKKQIEKDLETLKSSLGNRNR